MASPTLLEIPDYKEMAQDLQESYQDIEAEGLSASDLIPTKDLSSPSIDVANILFGDEMASVGVTYDKKGLEFNLETAKDAWVKHPIASGLAVATTLIPLLGTYKKLRKASALADFSDEMVTKAGFVAIEDGVDISKIAETDKELMRINAKYYADYRDNSEKMKLIQDKSDEASVKEKAFYYADRAITNKYLEDIDPLNAPNVRADWIKSTSEMMREDGRFARHLKNLPPDDAILGTKIARMLVDPKAIDEIPDKYKEAALLFAEDKKTLDLAAIKEGFVSKEEVNHIGETWFSTAREGTQQDFGKYTTVLDTTSSDKPRVLRVPKTSSPNLLTRQATKEEVKQTVDRQLASELLASGQKTEALSLLKGPGFEDTKKLIKDGDITGAINLLSVGSKIDFTPKSLTFNTLFNQKMLLENFRMIRDLALNSDITKPGDYIAALSPRTRRGWMKLDTLPGADRLRRMVAVSKQVDPDSIKELGWVPKGVFKELNEITGGSTGEAIGGWMSFLSAIHKTARTAFNLPTHFSNVIGNWGFLVNAGVNPFSSDFIKLQQMSASAIKQIQKAARSGEDISVLKNFGTVDSLVGGKKISLADELNSNELNDIIEKSTLTASEGIGVIEKIAESKDFLGDIAKFTNKAITATKGYIPADLYLREDAMVKMAYFLQLRQKGFSRAAAAIEVGKRLPMYHKIGGAARTARSWLLPWVSFPAEAARILKNNAIDHPFKTALMLQIPELAQVGMYFGARAMGQDLNYQGIKQRKDQLATWANKPSTIISPFMDRNKDIRSMVLDFLPFTSLMPPTVATEAPVWKKLPFGLDEPMPILNGLRMAMTGQDTWGREIPIDPNNPSKRIGVAALSLMGFMAPPIAEKYLFNPSDVEFGYRFMTEAGKNINPYTEKPGDAVFDLLLNNISPVKSYPASPEQQLANESFSRQQLTNFRGSLAKKWSALLKSGDVEGAADLMADIHKTFYIEWGDVGMAQRKMDDWLVDHAKTISKHPQLRGFSKEEIVWKIRNQTEAAADMRTRAQAQLIESMRRELAGRGRRSNGGTKNPFLFSE